MSRKKPGPPRVDPVARFIDKVEFPDDPNDCWLWTACKDARGYGRFGAGGMGATMAAYRWAYLTFVGPIEDGLVLDHVCCNQSCVNPDHLEPVTSAENTRRASRQITVCKNGHPLDEANTYYWVSPRGTHHRRCRKCNSEASARAYARARCDGTSPYRTVNA